MKTNEPKYKPTDLTQAPFFYTTDERKAADDQFQTTLAMRNTLRDAAKAAPKDKETKKSLKAYDALVEEARVRRDSFPEPKRSASYMAAELLADIANYIAEDKAIIEKNIADLHRSISYTFTWNMEDLVGAEERATFYSRVLAHLNTAEAHSLTNLIAILDMSKKDLERKIMSYSRRLNSRSTSQSSNLVEDMIISTDAQLVDAGFGRSRWQYYAEMVNSKSDEIVYDEATYWPTFPTETYFDKEEK